MKFITFFVLFAAGFMLFLSGTAYSREYHHGIVIEQVDNTATTNIYSSNGVASAISAAQCQFDGGSFDLQLCGAAGYSDNQEAFTFGIGQKYKDFLINGTVSLEDNKARYGIGLNWKVK